MVSVSEIIKILRYGQKKDRIEAITLARGRVNEMLLRYAIQADRIKQLKQQVSMTGSLSNEEIKQLLPVLSEFSLEGDLFVCWYAAIVVIELGELTNESREQLWNASNQFISWAAQTQMGNDSPSAISAMYFEIAGKEETIRALSRFKNQARAGEMLKESLEGKALRGRQQDNGRDVLYAFGALGISDYRELVEYWATHGDDTSMQSAAKAALALWGQASYDEIKNSVQKASGSDGCYIATTCYGSYDAPEVLLLRKYRDETLSRSLVGEQLVTFYYRISPYCAQKLQEYPILNKVIKKYILNTVVTMIEAIGERKRL